MGGRYDADLHETRNDDKAFIHLQKAQPSSETCISERIAGAWLEDVYEGVYIVGPRGIGVVVATAEAFLLTAQRVLSTWLLRIERFTRKELILLFTKSSFGVCYLVANQADRPDHYLVVLEASLVQQLRWVMAQSLQVSADSEPSVLQLLPIFQLCPSPLPYWPSRVLLRLPLCSVLPPSCLHLTTSCQTHHLHQPPKASQLVCLELLLTLMKKRTGLRLPLLVEVRTLTLLMV